MIVLIVKVYYFDILHRERIANLEKALEKCEQEKYTLECRIEQRHLQV
jgi:hypothetical protein